MNFYCYTFLLYCFINANTANVIQTLSKCPEGQQLSSQGICEVILATQETKHLSGESDESISLEQNRDESNSSENKQNGGIRHLNGESDESNSSENKQNGEIQHLNGKRDESTQGFLPNHHVGESDENEDRESDESKPSEDQSSEEMVHVSVSFKRNFHPKMMKVIDVPGKCPDGQKIDAMGKCREIWD